MKTFQRYMSSNCDENKDVTKTVNGQRATGNGQRATGNGQRATGISEIVVHDEINFFIGYFDIFRKRFAPK